MVVTFDERLFMAPGLPLGGTNQPVEGGTPTVRSRWRIQRVDATH